MDKVSLAIGSDHVGYPLKEVLKEFFRSNEILVKDMGTYSTDRTDYPTFARSVAEAVQSNECEKGILICGSGVGMAIAANKFSGIRAVVCTEPYSAKVSREHNDTNILALGARVVGNELAKMIVDAWLSGQFEGGRHAKRLLLLNDNMNSCFTEATPSCNE